MRRQKMCVLVRLACWSMLFVFVFSPQAWAQEQRLLFVGNSYTFFNAPHTVEQVTAKLMSLGVPAWQNVHSQRVAPGGYRWQQHADDAEGKTGSQDLRRLLVTSKDAMHQWDTVVLQEQSQIPGFPFTNTYWLASLSALQRLHRLIQARKAETVLMMTWGRRKGDPRNAALFGTYEAMQQRLTAGYLEFAKRAGSAGQPLLVAPVGLAWKEIFDGLKATGQTPEKDGTLFSRLYDPDGSHPSQVGSYLAGCVVYATLTGRDPSGISWYPNNALPAAERSRLQLAARRVVLEPIPGAQGLRYAWDVAWPQFKSAPDVMPPNVVAVSSTGVVPRVSFATKVKLTKPLLIGAKHKDGLLGEGRVFVRKGAVLEFPELIVGDEGKGEFAQVEGSVKVERIVLGKEPGAAGVYVLSGGSLSVTSWDKGAGRGRFVLRGGSLRSAKINADLEQRAGRWRSVDRSGKAILSPEVAGRYWLMKGGHLDVAIVEPLSKPLVPGKTHRALVVKGEAKIEGRVTLSVSGAALAQGKYEFAVLKSAVGVTITPTASVVVPSGMSATLSVQQKRLIVSLIVNAGSATETKPEVTGESHPEKGMEAIVDVAANEPGASESVHDSGADASGAAEPKPERDAKAYLPRDRSGPFCEVYVPSPPEDTSVGGCQTSQNTPEFGFFLCTYLLLVFFRRRQMCRQAEEDRLQF